jgi:hypothetical protein
MVASNGFMSILQESVAEATGNAPEVKSESSEPTPQEEVAPQQPAAPPPTQEAPQKAEAVPEKVEEKFIDVKDEEGRTRRVKVDAKKSLEEYAKDAYNYQKGMRKFQQERDQALKLKDSAEKWIEINKTFKDKGMEGLIDTLGGKEGAYKEFIKSIEEKAIKRYGASEDELRALDREEQYEQERQARIRAEQKAEEYINEVKTREFEANKAKVESRLEAAFDKVRMDGRLGDEAKEAEFNRIIWRDTLDTLEDYREANKLNEWDIPVEVVAATFKKKADLFLNTIPALASKQAEKVVEKKKEEATRHAQEHSTSVASGKMSFEEQAEAYMGKSNSARGLFNSLFSGFKQ